MSTWKRFSLARLAWRGLFHHRRAHLAALLAVTTATAIITGALVVGDSVRGSLRDRVLERLGRVDHVLTSSGWFRATLADALGADDALTAERATVTPAIVLRGTVVNADPASERRSGQVNIYGVTPAFWTRWEGAEELPPAFEASSGQRIGWLNEQLAKAVSIEARGDVLVYFQKGEEIAAEHLLGTRSDRVRPLRLTVDRVIEDAGAGLFRLDQGQQVVHNIYIPLRLLQRSLEKTDFVNTLLVGVRTETARAESGWLSQALHRTWRLEDAGLRLLVPEGRAYASLESRELLLTEPVVEAARGVATRLGAARLESLTYLANTIAVGDREIPYSMVAAVGSWRSRSESPPESALAAIAADRTSRPGGIVLNEWAATDLGATVGDTVRLKYFVVAEDNSLDEAEASFELTAVVPLSGDAADPGWTPLFPGITDADSLRNWDPPFEVDLQRMRDQDDEYWDDHRTTPKAFLSLADGVKLWSSRFGEVTSLRVRPQAPGDRDGTAMTRFASAYTEALLSELEPRSVGLVWRPVKAEGLAAATGATDFSMLFISFSFFLIISALVLLALIFRLSCELRFVELGTLLSLGYEARDVRVLLVREGWGLIAGGALLGAFGGLGYAALLIEGLRTLWSGAVNAPFLAVHVTPVALVVGAVLTAVLAFVTIYAVARRTARIPPRTLLAGPGARAAGPHQAGERSSWLWWLCGGAGVAGALLLILAALTRDLPPEGLFFGAGVCGLVAGLTGFSIIMRRPRQRSFRARGWRSLVVLGVRNTGRLPRRSLLTATVLACASFLVVTVAAQRRDARVDLPEKTSGNGGFALAARSAVPLTQSLSTAEGREELVLSSKTIQLLEQAGAYAFRVRPGDDASCLNLYRPTSPRILGAPPDFLERGGFAWAGSLAQSATEEANPWLLLEKDLPDGAVPVVGDLNTVMWILHSGLGQDLELVDDTGKELRLRLVGLLSHSIFQGELIASERHFRERFPGRTGRSFFLLEGPQPIVSDLSGALEKDLQDYGFDAQTTGELLAAYKQVENTYLSTFQILGGLGLLLGTVGLGVVLYRNVNERRGELAVLRAVGFSPGAISWLIFSETAILLCAGLVVGGGTALLAVIPQLASSGSEASFGALAIMMLVIILCGLGAALVSLRAALRAPLLPALRAE